MNLSFRRQAAPSAFGLDISPSGIKYVQLKRTKHGLAVDACGNVPFTIHGPVHTYTDQELIQQLVTALKGVSLSKNVVASLPESKTFMEVVNVMKNEQDSFQKRLTETLPEYLPLPVEESYYDSTIIREEGDRWVALVGAAPRATVESYLSVLQAADLIPLVLDIEAPTVVRAVLREAPQVDGATAILDLGQSHAALIIVEHGAIQFTMSLPIAGETVTNDIAAALHLSTTDAEVAKRSCGDHPEQCPSELKTIIEKTVLALTAKVREAELYYADHFTDAGAISRVYLCGGGAHLVLLNHTLSEALKVPVDLATPWHSIENAPTNSPLSLTTALGLALRALDAPNTI